MTLLRNRQESGRGSPRRDREVEVKVSDCRVHRLLSIGLALFFFAKCLLGTQRHIPEFNGFCRFLESSNGSVRDCEDEMRKFWTKLEPTIGLEPMTCRLRIIGRSHRCDT